MVNNTLLQIIVCLSRHEFIYLHVIQYITPWTPAQDQFNQEKKKRKNLIDFRLVNY